MKIFVIACDIASRRLGGDKVRRCNWTLLRLTRPPCQTFDAAGLDIASAIFDSYFLEDFRMSNRTTLIDTAVIGFILS